MKLDSEYVLFENSGQYFPSYDKAYWNAKISHNKKVKYVFTPTMTLCDKVGDLYRVARNYFKENFDCDYLVPQTHEKIMQLSLINQI